MGDTAVLDRAVDRLDGLVVRLGDVTAAYRGPRDDRPRSLWAPERRRALRERL